MSEVDAASATDREWHLNPVHAHLFCGGCGSETMECHPGLCCTEAKDHLHDQVNVCGLCTTRVATGQITSAERAQNLADESAERCPGWRRS